MINAPQSKASQSMPRKRRFFPFNAEQTINILSEFGPLATMFIVNAIYDINTGTWALILTTILAIVVMFYMHLKYDARLFRALFTGPLIIAVVTIISLLFLFGHIAVRVGGG